MCIDCYVNGENYIILVGLLNGQIMRLYISDEGGLTADEFVRTHADLIANPDIKLSNCKFESENIRKSFESQFKDYFTI